MNFWMIDTDQVKAVLITDKTYNEMIFREFIPLFVSANTDMVYEPLISVLEEMAQQLEQPIIRKGFHVAAHHIRTAIAELKKANEVNRSA